MWGPVHPALTDWATVITALPGLNLTTIITAPAGLNLTTSITALPGLNVTTREM